MTIKEIMTAIQEEYTTIFPHSASYVRNGALSSGDDESQCLTTYLGNKETFANGISDNDQMTVTYWIFNPMNEDGKFTIELSSTGSGLYINPTAENKYMAMSCVKVPFRKKTMTADKLIIAMRKQFQKAKEIVESNSDNIYKNQKLKECGII